MDPMGGVVSLDATGLSMNHLQARLIGNRFRLERMPRTQNISKIVKSSGSSLRKQVFLILY